MGEIAMNCRSFRKQYVELLLPTDDQSKAELKSHLEGCSSCTRFFAQMKQTLAALQPSHKVVASTNFKEQVMNKIKEPIMDGNYSTNKMKQKPRVAERGQLGRLFRWPAMATVIVLALAFTLLVVNNSRNFHTQAYAIEQTLEANRGVRFIHMQFEPCNFGQVSDMWAQFDENGLLLHLRYDFPDTEDGPKVVNWAAAKADVWFKKKNSFATITEKNILNRMQMTITDFDPRLIMERIDKESKAGKWQVEQRPSTDNDGTITLAVTGNGTKDGQIIYKVDQASKLLKEVERYQNKDGQYELLSRIRYLDYNQPVEPDVFTLNPSADVVRFDETTQVIGLAKGDLTDKEIATKVVREFFEALIAKDYAKAGMLYSGVPAEFLEKQMGNIKFLKIISIDEPVPHEETRSLRVPCKIEVEQDGKKDIMEPNGPFVRPVHSQPDRWTIIGGI
jgi:hypothetical protein